MNTTINTFDAAYEIINEAYMQMFVFGTYSYNEIDEVLIGVLVRRGVSRRQAAIWVSRFLDA